MGIARTGLTAALLSTVVCVPVAVALGLILAGLRLPGFTLEVIWRSAYA